MKHPSWEARPRRAAWWRGLRASCAAVVLLVGLERSALGQLEHRPDEWTETEFFKKPDFWRDLLARPGNDPRTAVTVVGKPLYYEVRDNDTFLDVARYYGLGHNDIFEANPGVDEWIPPVGQHLLLATQFVLPDVPFTGVRVNIPEMRLYYFRPGPNGTVIVTTYPVGLGRDEWRTPTAAFKIRGKTVNPRWVLPESIKREHRQLGKPAPDFIAGGAPDNPLGKFRLELTLDMYGIHGTNIPWGVGMQVSHGCVRLYPEDIERLFPEVPIGSPGEFLYQPVKVGSRDGRIFVEVHRDIYTLKPGLYQEAMRLIDKRGWRGLVDTHRVERAVTEQSGVPIDVTRTAGSGGDLPDERVGNSIPPLESRPVVKPNPATRD